MKKEFCCAIYSPIVAIPRALSHCEARPPQASPFPHIFRYSIVRRSLIYSLCFELCPKMLLPLGERRAGRTSSGVMLCTAHTTHVAPTNSVVDDVEIREMAFCIGGIPLCVWKNHLCKFIVDKEQLEGKTRQSSPSLLLPPVPNGNKRRRNFPAYHRIFMQLGETLSVVWERKQNFAMINTKCRAFRGWRRDGVVSGGGGVETRNSIDKDVKCECSRSSLQMSSRLHSATVVESLSIHRFIK